ncbi:hypothetical protein VZ957_004542 [Salmonella enterica]|nr:hypothetical protein [Salmonella enterica]
MSSKVSLWGTCIYEVKGLTKLLEGINCQVIEWNAEQNLIVDLHIIALSAEPLLFWGGLIENMYDISRIKCKGVLILAPSQLSNLKLFPPHVSVIDGGISLDEMKYEILRYLRKINCKTHNNMLERDSYIEFMMDLHEIEMLIDKNKNKNKNITYYRRKLFKHTGIKNYHVLKVAFPHCSMSDLLNKTKNS